MASEGHLACESPSKGTSILLWYKKRCMWHIKILDFTWGQFGRVLNIKIWYILQDFCYCCCCEKGTRRKSSNLDLTISCLHLKINSVSYGVISLVNFPVYVRFSHSARNQNSWVRFSVSIAFDFDVGGRKGTKTARVEWEHWNAP